MRRSPNKCLGYPHGRLSVVKHRQRTVCAKHTIGSGIFLVIADGTLGDKAQVEAQFGLFRDSANLDAI
jgi:hypothetical protein